MFSLLLLIGCANQDYEEEENLDRIGNTLVLDGVCSKEINQCAPGNPILYDEPCEHFCDVCWYCEGITVIRVNSAKLIYVGVQLVEDNPFYLFDSF